MDRLEHRSQVCRDGTRQSQDRRAILCDSRGQQCTSMDVNRTELPPTSAEFQLNAAGEPSVMPADGSPTDRFLQTVPASPELHYIRYPTRHVRKRFLPKLP